MDIKAIGLNKVLKKFDAMKIDPKKVAPVIRKGTQLVQRDAKKLSPFDTGNLRGSIGRKTIVSDKQVTGIVGTNVEYAIHQEFGTSKQPGKAFLRPALRKNKDRVKNMLAGYVSMLVRKAGK